MSPAEECAAAGAYSISWHDPGDGWIKIVRDVELAQLGPDVIEAKELEKMEISPQ